MNKHLWNDFIKIVQQEVTPALGCTEPIAIALAASIARQKLSGQPIKISAKVSPNVMKNGIGVGVPGTGMVGLPIAAAIGAIAGNPNAGLEVLEDVTLADVQAAKTLLDNGSVTVDVADVDNILYSKVTAYDGNKTVSVTIADGHTNVVSVEENGISIYVPSLNIDHDQSHQKSINPFEYANAKDIFDFATHAPLSDIEFIEAAGTLNDKLSVEGLTNDYGLQIGATFQRNVERGLLSGGLLTEVLTRTSSAADARMDGAMFAAMSNSGSGNQGIAASMPVYVTAQFLKASREQTIRSLMLANLMAIYIKSQQDKLSALCATTTAGMGAVSGMTWLLGGNFVQIGYAISNMIGDVSGIICDGAKPSCAMKVSSSAGAAVKAALMAIDGVRVSGNDGIVANDVEESIKNLSALVNGSMKQTDTQILDIMVNK
ncbi:L-serine ammonia-lyase, iron-sulfur-dependent, subunit alpha [Vibrio sp. TH_r3]|uniref:L-cysteine desulfidase family protein n=1 Tax=Vibrio sp. TH_r3 TaxID=3082084 RepID=UPI002953E72D|nr:L-serine ammonia-lyase, iron-sulfur-dependent, subunit alpha [Vibrio sp. TH_r3]MDV7103099.1 L-serine ammonia-lyase, iron-sulfur-dependent, subunit alpha [Vibrio sp. TH_r3]